MGGLRTGDFLDFDSPERFEVVIGNPPYVRYQSFAGVPRAKSRALALRYHVPLSGLASSWAAFTVHATNFLTDDGRLGLVLPAELLTVNYAAPVRSFLLRRFARVRLVLFEERVFPGVLEEVVLLLAEGSGGTDHFELLQAADLADLEQHLTSTTWAPPVHDAKWLGALLSVESAAAYARVTEGPAFTTLERWGDTTLGMVTGTHPTSEAGSPSAPSASSSSSDPTSPPGDLDFLIDMLTKLTHGHDGYDAVSLIVAHWDSATGDVTLRSDDVPDHLGPGPFLATLTRNILDRTPIYLHVRARELLTGRALHITEGDPDAEVSKTD